MNDEEKDETEDVAAADASEAAGDTADGAASAEAAAEQKIRGARHAKTTGGGAKRFFIDVAAVITAIALGVSFISCGLAVCAGIPQITEGFSAAFSDTQRSSFSADELTDMALATRAYTITENDYDALMEAIAQANDDANTPYAGASLEALAQADEAYTLTPDAISHLDDVYNVVVTAAIILIIIAVIAAAGIVFLALVRGKRTIGSIMLAAGIGVCALFVVLGLIAAVNFNLFFAAFHALFFESGSWVFSADSLLICMYPDEFWMGMGIVWLATTLVLSILSIVIGALMRRRRVKSAA